MALTIELVGHTDAESLLRASCAVVGADSDGSSAPEWIHIAPAGKVVARDGREFDFAGPITAELPLLLDYEHASEMPNGSTRAAGWIEELASRADGIWGRVRWTAQGASDVASLSYRYLSPVLVADKASRAVSRIVSVALTNTPALAMTAMDAFRGRFAASYRFEAGLPPQGERMDKEKLKALCGALKIAEDAADDAVIEACSRLESQVREACAARDAAVSALAELQATSAKESLARDIDATLDAAARDGKVSPAMAKGIRAMCSTQDAFHLFKDSVLPALPKIADAAPPPPEEGAIQDSAVVALCRDQGMTDTQIKDAMKRIGRTAAKEE